MGLSIAKRLTELMGGVIGVKSESGKGSTFTFTVAVDYEEAEKLSFEKDKENEPKMLPLQNKIAFIVEKNPIQLEAIRLKLEKWGLEAYTASSNLEAIEIPSQVPPNFVIISIDDFDYDRVQGLSNEVRLKLKTIKPATLAQAGRISGVTPAAVSLLLIYLKKHGMAKMKLAG